MECAACGAELAAGAQFCPRCGTAVTVSGTSGSRAVPFIKEPVPGIYDDRHQDVQVRTRREARGSVAEQLWPAGAARTPQEESLAKDSRPVIVTITALVLTFIVLAIYFAVSLNSTDPEGPPSTLSVPGSGSPTGKKTAAAKPSATKPSSGVEIPRGATECGRGRAPYVRVYKGTSSTSCQFAKAVRNAYAKMYVKPVPSASIKAKSPVTKKSYTLKCSATPEGVVRCTGGQNAVVILAPQ